MRWEGLLGDEKQTKYQSEILKRRELLENLGMNRCADVG
jgi:hypothetical protein